MDIVLTVSFSVTNLRDVLRLAASSREARDHCLHLITSQRPCWLQKAIQDGQAHAIKWLLQDQPQLLHVMADDLLNTPRVSLEVASELLTLGLRPSYEQIVAKARQGVPGAYIWPRAYRQLQLQSDIPMRAEALCCGEVLVSNRAPAMHASSSHINHLGNKSFTSLPILRLSIPLCQTRTSLHSCSLR
jgi:hypothetical protein